jgi:MATE family multidrug resistance protein
VSGPNGIENEPSDASPPRRGSAVGLPSEPSGGGTDGVFNLGGIEAGCLPANDGSIDPTEPTLAQIDEHPLREMVRVAAPSVVTMTSYTVMQFIDKLMVKSIGPEPVYVAAQGNAGITSWTLMAFVLGLTGVLSTFVSQNLGAGKARAGASYVWNGMYMAFGFYVLAMLPAALMAPWYFSQFSSHSEQLRELETLYAQIVLFGALGTLGARTMAQFFYGLHRPWIVMVAAIAGNVVNVTLNSALIFGNWGAPELGIAGAAWGTVVGGVVELIIPVAVFLSPKYARTFSTLTSWRPDFGRVREIIKLGLPMAMMMVNEMICWSILMTVLIGSFGELHNTAGWIALGYMHLSFMPAVGLSTAMAAIVGKCVGAGRYDLAVSRTWLGLRLTLGYMGLCGLCYVIFREELIALFIDSDTSPEDRAELIRIGAQIMIAAAVFQLFDALAILLTGSLRGAGDTVWPGVVTIVLSWVCVVGVGWAAVVWFPQLGSLGPWIGAASYIICLGIGVLWRFRSGKWRAMGVVKPDQIPEKSA